MNKVKKLHQDKNADTIEESILKGYTKLYSTLKASGLTGAKLKEQSIIGTAKMYAAAVANEIGEQSKSKLD